MKIKPCVLFTIPAGIPSAQQVTNACMLQRPDFVSLSIYEKIKLEFEVFNQLTQKENNEKATNNGGKSSRTCHC